MLAEDKAVLIVVAPARYSRFMSWLSTCVGVPQNDTPTTIIALPLLCYHYRGQMCSRRHTPTLLVPLERLRLRFTERCKCCSLLTSSSRSYLRFLLVGFGCDAVVEIAVVRTF
jgi:hypothetical protein